MKRLHIFALVCVLATLFALLFMRTEKIKAAPSSQRTSWSVVSSPNVGTGSNVLNAVAAISTNNIWAVGYSSADANAPAQALIEHWDGTQWSVVPGPTPTNSWTSSLSGITAIATNDVWAVGYFDVGNNAFSLIEHWDSTGWSIISSPNPGAYSNILSGTSAISFNDVWTVGNFSASSTGKSRTLTEHWNGTRWSVVPSPNVGARNNMFSGVSTLSDRDVWAVGYGSHGLIEHWDGTRWSVVFNQWYNFKAVTAISKKDVWAIGYLLNHGNQQPLLEHWDGHTWRKAPNSYPGGLSEILGVVGSTPHDVWAVGYNDPGTLIEHWSGSQWSIVASPNSGSQLNFLLGAARIPGTKQVVAVGYYTISGNNPEEPAVNQTLVESYS